MLFDFDILGGAVAIVVLGMVPMIGGFLVTYVGFVGAVRGWRMPWWAALLVVWPSLAFIFAGFASIGFDSLVEWMG